MKRRTMIGGLGAIAVAAFGGAAWKFGLLRKHYPPTPYDDLLDQIVDRVPAARLGAAVLKARPELNAAGLAATLRQPRNALATRARLDADQDRLFEVQGWLVPQSVALYAALAAKAA